MLIGRKTLWIVVIALCVLGVSAAIARSMYISDLGTLAEPLREQLNHALGHSDPFPDARWRAVRAFDAPYGSHPLMTLLHVLPAAFFLAFAPLQFSTRIRTRYLNFHRWSGRCLVIAGCLIGLAALFF